MSQPSISLPPVPDGIFADVVFKKPDGKERAKEALRQWMQQCAIGIVAASKDSPKVGN